MRAKKINRRRFLQMSAMAALGAAAVACGQAAPTAAPTQAPAAATEAPTEAPAQTEPTATQGGAAEATAAPTTGAITYQESPMLADLVKAGKLPPIEQRLPEQPLVVGPGVLIAKQDLDWQPGKFGGTMRFAHAVADWNPDIFIMANENLLAAPGIALEGLYPNVVQDYQVSDDGKEFTFTLRKGMKWSDGEPVTTEDVRFTFEDVYGDKNITPTFPAKFCDGGRVGGQPLKLTIVDDFTWKFTFSEPYGGLLRELADKGWQGYTDTLRPSHYLKQYHIKYTKLDDPKMQEQLKRLNLKDEWWQVFNAMNCNNWDLTNPKSRNYPVLYPWMAVEGPDQVLTFERNPYYWKVDTQGQQLPYVDKLVSQQVLDVEALTLKVLAGEVDYVRESTALNKLPLYKQNEDKAGIKFNLMDNHVDPTALWLNFTYPDDNWRKVVGDVRFRQALTLGLNRQEFIDSIYYGYAQPPTLVPSQFDAAKANQLLDEMGLDKLDADGFRIGPDGKTFVLMIEHGASAPDIAPVGDLIGAQLQKNLKLKVQVTQLESNLWGQRNAANDLHSIIIWDVQPMWPDGTWTDYLVNATTPLWDQWRTSSGKQGEEPPDAIKDIYKQHDIRNQSVPYSDADKAAYEAIRKNLHDNVWIIPIAEKVNYAMVYSAKLGNIPKSGQAIGADYSGEQFFFQS